MHTLITYKVNNYTLPENYFLLITFSDLSLISVTALSNPSYLIIKLSNYKFNKFHSFYIDVGNVIIIYFITISSFANYFLLRFRLHYLLNLLIQISKIHLSFLLSPFHNSILFQFTLILTT